MQSLDTGEEVGLPGLFNSSTPGISFGFDKIPLVEILDNRIEARYHLSGVVDQLQVEFLVVFANVFSLDIKEDVGFVLVQILQFDPVSKLAHDFPIVHLGLFELEDELLDSGGDLVEENSSAVDEGIGLRGGEVGARVVQTEGVVVGSAKGGL